MNSAISVLSNTAILDQDFKTGFDQYLSCMATTIDNVANPVRVLYSSSYAANLRCSIHQP
eukprot:529628-Amphidinium_carterae.1